MAISLTCSECGKRLKARDELAGKLLPCPNCKCKVLVPGADEKIASYSLQEESPATSLPSPSPAPGEPAEEEEPKVIRRRAVKPETKTRKTQPMPLLTTNAPPFWLRHLHWLLVLALLPLTFSLLKARGEDVRARQFKETIEKATPDEQMRIIQVLERMENGEASRAEFFAVLPGHKLVGALLSGNSYAHWGFAAAAAALFTGFFLILASRKTADPLHLLGFGVFTATIGILLLMLFQVLADWSQGFWLTGRSILVLLFYVVKFIGFSYRAALDPDTNFFLSFMGFTLGVGFCEEVCKALPLLFYYHNSTGQRWRTAFLWGLASGTGFGIAEGILYSSRYYNGIHGADTYVVRFISCVALHALWTGSVGITLHQKHELIQGATSWYDYIPRLLVIVAIPMILHGLYDTLLKKDMNGFALGVAVLSFLFLAFQISRLHGEDDEEAHKSMLREYKRRRAALS